MGSGNKTWAVIIKCILMFATCFQYQMLTMEIWKSLDLCVHAEMTRCIEYFSECQSSPESVDLHIFRLIKDSQRI